MRRILIFLVLAMLTAACNNTHQYGMQSLVAPGEDSTKVKVRLMVVKMDPAPQDTIYANLICLMIDSSRVVGEYYKARFPLTPKNASQWNKNDLLLYELNVPFPALITPGPLPTWVVYVE